MYIRKTVDKTIENVQRQRGVYRWNTASTLHIANTTATSSLLLQKVKNERKNKTMHYQKSWKEKLPWVLEVSDIGILCGICKTASNQDLLNIAMVEHRMHVLPLGVATGRSRNTV